ncbi:MFS transporter [Hansschlegelia zhihuaiae]|uniref:MFS transporter n=1 Tax=Hansschlegelia zhihuaiae TaxID=405005 RepID=A0A4Q0MIB2_9HYPH|nr:MFS transporter [Hansschlegelia zhihuaiae]RXF72769.1 MFS transporter [Hansschlegelia zhihuaiae]
MTLPLSTAGAPRRRDASRTLVVAGLVHALHDGYTDLIYVLLPVWQAEFGLSYSLLALLRGLYAGAMALLQVPAARLSERFGGRAILAAGTILAALGYMLAGLSGGAIGLCASLALSGAGSSAQHPIASAAVSRAYGGAAARGPIGTYNFSGDLGKAALPALTALLVTLTPWRHALWLIGVLGLIAAAAIAFMPAIRSTGGETSTSSQGGVEVRGGFALLCFIGSLDTAARMGFLTFLPFMLQSKGATLPTIGAAFTAVFIGGALGKFACGWLGARLGVTRTVLLTEGATVVLIFAAMALPLAPSLFLLPVVGVALNGTSSVLYGAVPELSPAGRVENAFAVFYTAVIGAGALAPVLFGVVGDAGGWGWGMACAGGTALLTLPAALMLGGTIATISKPAAPKSRQ